MTLVECSDCGEEISARARSCPNCGGPTAEASELNVVLWVIFAVLLSAGIALAVSIVL